MSKYMFSVVLFGRLIYSIHFVLSYIYIYIYISRIRQRLQARILILGLKEVSLQIHPGRL